MTPLSSIEQHVAVTPSDATNFTGGKCRAIYVGAVVAIVGGAAVTYAAVPVGTTLWIAATRINSTNTTATNLVAQY